VYEGPTPTKFGQYQVAPSRQFRRLHLHDGSPLHEVEHHIPIGVLDQEDLFAQGIDTSKLVPGARRVDALGSCTCNSGTAHVAERWTAAGRDLAGIHLTAATNTTITLSATNTAADEEFAVVLYHAVTDQTGDPATEWPPTDCGSSGYYVCTELERKGFARSYRSAPNVLGALSLLQTGTVMQGAPWFNAWMQPDSQGFIDGDGSLDALYAAIESGVAGGHETLQYAIPQLGQLRDGTTDLTRTVIRVRNSWSAGWGPLGGDYLIHASTLDYLGQYADYKAITV